MWTSDVLTPVKKKKKKCHLSIQNHFCNHFIDTYSIFAREYFFIFKRVQWCLITAGLHKIYSNQTLMYGYLEWFVWSETVWASCSHFEKANRELTLLQEVTQTQGANWAKAVALHKWSNFFLFKHIWSVCCFVEEKKQCRASSVFCVECNVCVKASLPFP